MGPVLPTIWKEGGRVSLIFDIKHADHGGSDVWDIVGTTPSALGVGRDSVGGLAPREGRYDSGYHYHYHSYLSMARTCSPSFILCLLAAALTLTVSMSSSSATLTLTPQSVSKLPFHTLELLLTERGVACNDCLHIDDYASLLLESQHLPIVLQRDQNKTVAKSAIPLPPLSLQVQSD
jgi:hypothetical protein